jgi:hypothetical protein
MEFYKEPVDIRKIIGPCTKVPGTSTNIKVAVTGLYQRKAQKKIVRKMMCNLLAFIYNSTNVVKSDFIGLLSCGDGPTGRGLDLILMYERMGFQICAVSSFDPEVFQKIVDYEELTHKDDTNCNIGMSQTVGSLLGWCEHTLK